eukprot:5188413-Lingulodinium_polyedra.AAC.1
MRLAAATKSATGEPTLRAEPASQVRIASCVDRETATLERRLLRVKLVLAGANTMAVWSV